MALECPDIVFYPANMRRWPNIGLLLAHRLRSWPNSKSALSQRLGGGGGGGEMGVTSARPSTPKRFCLSSNQVFLFFVTKFFVFAFRWFRVFHWGCYVYFRIVFISNSLYILYIFIFIYFIYFFIVLVVPYSALTDYDRSVVLTLDDRPDPQLWGHCRSTHNSSMICFLCVCSGFSLESWRWTGCPKETIAI